MRGTPALTGISLFLFGCAAHEVEPAIGPPLPPAPAAVPIEATPGVAEEPTPSVGVADEPALEADAEENEPIDIYARSEALRLAVEGLCFFDAPAVTAQVAPFDGGVGLAITSDQVERLRGDAQLFAEAITAFDPPEHERVLVAGSDETPEAINVSIEVQEAPGGVMFVIVPDDPRRAGELMRRLQRDAETLASGACAEVEGP